MDDKARTPRENYERKMNGEDVETGSKANAAFAKHLLRSQAGKLATEQCVESITFTPNDTNPWAAGILFSAGELSENAQTLLNAMRSNAHRTEMTEDNGMVQITFYVHTLEED